MRQKLVEDTSLSGKLVFFSTDRSLLLDIADQLSHCQLVSHGPTYCWLYELFSSRSQGSGAKLTMELELLPCMCASLCGHMAKR